ncbi:MAG: tyrosine-type recombinase/integrase [Lachnospiraceae bacterium]|nr:tyrosine-type recombinase/integrase [Lachnospiraceae bacterium]
MKKIIKNVLKSMKNTLNEQQLQMLEGVLERELISKQQRERKNNEQLLEEFIKSKMYENCSSETLAQYKRENTRFLNCINKKVENIDKKDVEKYLTDYRYERKVSDRTLNNARAFISAFFNYLEFEDIIKCNPVRKTKPVKEAKRLKASFTELQVEQMRECAITDREKAIIETLNTTGVRVSELCNIDIKDIENGAAVIRGKGNKERTVYFSDKALYYISRYINGRKDENTALFVNQKKSNGKYNRISKGTVEKIVRDIGKKVEVRAYPHKFRRTVATRGGNKGMPIQEIQALLGHSKLDTTMIYCNVSDANVQMSHRKYIA